MGTRKVRSEVKRGDAVNLMILITGARGLLGTHLLPLLPGAVGIDIKECDLTDFNKTMSVVGNYDLVVHLAAYTDVAKAEEEKDKCYQTNVIGTRNLAELVPQMLYISSEYVFDGEIGHYNEGDYPNPQNFYSLTKLLGEHEALMMGHKIARLAFKPRPYKHDKVPGDMFTTGDYVDVIAPLLAKAVLYYDQLPNIIHIGTKKKRLLDLARQTRDVKEIKRSDVKTHLPKDTSFDLTLWRKFNAKHPSK